MSLPGLRAFGTHRGEEPQMQSTDLEQSTPWSSVAFFCACLINRYMVPLLCTLLIGFSFAMAINFAFILSPFSQTTNAYASPSMILETYTPAQANQP
jgi:hypothetical protein